MIYAHIYDHYGEIRVRYNSKADFSETEGGQSNPRSLIVTLEADDGQIQKKVFDYAVEKGICLSGTELSDADRVKMLEAVVYKLKCELEIANHARVLDAQKYQEKLFELRTVIDLQTNEIVMHETALEIAEEKGCALPEALYEAHEKIRIIFH